MGRLRKESTGGCDGDGYGGCCSDGYGGGEEGEYSEGGCGVGELVC